MRPAGGVCSAGAPYVGAVVPAWPLVGRDDELDQSIALSRSGGVLLVGAPGVGKSRLAAEVMERSAARRTARVRATSAAASVPLGAFAQVLSAHGDDGAGADAARLAGASARLLEGLAPEERLALWVDDVHSLDDTSATLLLGLATTGRVELILTMRSGVPVPEPITVLWRDELVGRLDVEPLDQSRIEQLLELALPGGVDGLAAAALAGACAGNLLYLRELVTGLQQSGELAEVHGRWFLLGPITAPPRLAELVAERLDRLGEPARRLLEALALAEPFGTALLERQGQWHLVQELLDAGLVDVVADGRRRQIRSVHPMHTEVARSLMSDHRRSTLLGELIDANSLIGSRRRGDERRLASWQLDAGRPADPAVLVDAARDALLGADAANAERFARAALAQVETGVEAAAAYVLGVALDDQGRFEEAERVLAAAPLEGTTDAERCLLALARCGVLLRGLNRRDDAEAVIDEALARIEDPRLVDELVAQRGAISLFAGEVDRTLEIVGPLSERGDERAFCEGALEASVANMLAGRSGAAIEIATRAFEVRIGLGEQVQLADPGIHLVALALAQVEHGLIEAAIDTARAAYQGAVEQRDRHGQAWLAVASARALQAAGRLRDAMRFGREAAVVFGELRHPGARWGYGALALAAGQAGATSEAVDAIADLDAEPATALTLMDAELHRARAWAAVGTEGSVAALGHLEHAARHARQAGQHTLEVAALHDVARIGAAVPSDWAVRIDELASELDGELVHARAAHVRGALLDDVELLGSAARRFSAMGAALFAAEAASAAASAAGRADARGDELQWSAFAGRELERCQDVHTPALRIPAPAGSLTRREREVAGMAAGGRSNRQIADQLVVSVRTVENHLQRVYDKLGISSRDQLAAVLESS